MKLQLFFVLFIFKSIEAFRIEGRVAQGHNAQKHIAPYIVSIQVETSPGNYHHSCGGAIIDSHWVLTAAHCLSDDERVRRSLIKAGRHNITSENEKTAQHRKIFYYKNQEKYPGGSVVAPHDVALIYVEKPFKWSKAVQPISLPKAGKNSFGNAILYGWGLVSDNSNEFPDILQTGEIPIISNDECFKHAGDHLDSTNICTLNKEGVSACSSDSGGPLVKLNKKTGKSELVGIVSWGPPCGKQDGSSYSVYVKVSSYISWIKKTQKTYVN